MENILYLILFLLMAVTFVLGKSLTDETHLYTYESIQSELKFRRGNYAVEPCPMEKFSCNEKPQGMYQDPFNCTNVFVCGLMGPDDAFTIQCPSGQQLNQESGECRPAPAPCTPCPYPSPPPPTDPLPQYCYEPFSCVGKPDGNYKDPWGCGETYYFCKGEVISTDDFIPYCRPGMYYDYEQKKCIKKDGVKACSPTCPVARPTTPPTTATEPPSTTPSLSCDEPYTCSDKTDGFHQDPWDCTQCYSCYDGKLNGYGTYCEVDKFGLETSDPILRSCENLCLNEQPTTTTTESPPYTSPPHNCDVPFTCSDKVDGYYPDPWDCTVCYSCPTEYYGTYCGEHGSPTSDPCSNQCSIEELTTSTTEPTTTTVPPTETPPTTLPSSTTTPTPPPPYYCLTPFTCADKFDPDGVHQDFWNCTMCYICTGYQMTDHTTDCWDTPVQSCTNICPNERPTKLVPFPLRRPAQREIY